MKFEKLAENKLKVILSTEDMIKWNITFDKLLTEENNTNIFFWEIISKAAKETGMKFDNCKLVVEALKRDENTYILIVTKKNIGSDFRIRYKLKRRNYTKTEQKSVLFFHFKGINDLICFAKANLFYCFLFDGNNSLYRFKNDLILELRLRDELKIYEKVFCDRISEYSVQKIKPEIYLSYIKEYGKIVIKDSALKTVYYKT